MTSTADLGALARGVIGVGFTGTTPGTAPLEALRAFGPGALILFARNVGTTEDLRVTLRGRESAHIPGLASEPRPLVRPPGRVPGDVLDHPRAGPPISAGTVRQRGMPEDHVARPRRDRHRRGR